jgi:hypothetical protein
MYCMVNEWGGTSNETEKKTKTQCHSRCGTINIPPCSKALSAEHRPKFCSPSQVMVTSPYTRAVRKVRGQAQIQIKVALYIFLIWILIVLSYMWIMKYKLLSNFKCNNFSMTSILDLDGDPGHDEILNKKSFFVLHISFAFCKTLRIVDLSFTL